MAKAESSLKEVMLIKILANKDGHLSASADVRCEISKQAVANILNALVQEIIKYSKTPKLN